MGRQRVPPDVAGLPLEAGQVAEDIRKGNSKSAVEAAKSLHKRCGTPASEALLVDAYCARVQSLREHRLHAEADALVLMVRQRHPLYGARLNDLTQGPVAAGQGLDNLLRPLADPAAAPEARAAAESAIRTQVSDPSLLLESRVLPPEHPLRQAATAVRKAFDAVTGGPVSDDALALPEVSRRSPLAPWKPLVRAIASYYRHEDDACRQHLAAIDPESAPARLTPVLAAMCGAGDARKLRPSAQSLLSRVSGDLEELRRVMKSLDSALGEEDETQFVEAVRVAARLASKECPDIQTAFRRQIAVGSMLADFSPGPVISAMGGSPKDDARLYLALARAIETEMDSPLAACHAWENFRVLALREKWFPARGPEAATLYLHMAELAGQLDEDEIRAEHRTAHREAGRDQVDPGAVGAALGFLHAEWLFKEACEMDPNPDAFLHWVTWAEKRGPDAAVETALDAWRTALPKDPRVLLRQIRRAEDRGKFTKAIRLLRQAEELDGVNAEVRRARLRLLILGAIRHIKERKPHLAEPELAQLDALPQARENDRPAFVAALRTVAALVAGQEDNAASLRETVNRLLGSPLAGACAIAAVASLCDFWISEKFKGVPGNWIEALVRLGAMSSDLGLHLNVPAEWKSAILAELKKPLAVGPQMLYAIGRMFVTQQWRDAVFAVSAAGLATKGSEAQSLLLRACALDESEFIRRADCFGAALFLARQERDAELEREIQNMWRDTTYEGSLGLEVEEIEPHLVEWLLSRERKSKAPKLPSFTGQDYRPRRRRRRRRTSDYPELPF